MSDYITEHLSLWDYLKGANKPIVLYGMGDGALKILDVCQQYGIPVAGIFASEGFVRGHSFMGYPVERLADLEARLGQMIILLAFGVDYDEMIDTIAAIAARQETYAPDLPVCGGELFTYGYYLTHREAFDEVYSRLADEKSRQVFADMLNFKISGKLPYLFGNMGNREEDFAEILSFSGGDHYVDLGAYDGDTIEEFIRHCPQYGSITAFEPDPKNFRKLTEATARLERVRLVPKGSHSGAAELCFAARGGRNSALAQEGKKLRTLPMTSVDLELAGARADYIKMDVEGAEEATLLGCRDTIAAFRPMLSVAAYHRSSDLYRLPHLIWELNPGYRLYLRRHKYIPAWEIILYAVQAM